MRLESNEIAASALKALHDAVKSAVIAIDPFSDVIGLIIVQWFRTTESDLASSICRREKYDNNSSTDTHVQPNNAKKLRRQ